MASQQRQEISSQPSEVSKFYDGKSLFITGAAGFLGTVLLEALLRLCPGIHRIYLLLRPKKGVQSEDRMEAIFKKEIFFSIKEKNPDALNKVFVIPGDVAHDNLGMNSDDLYKVCQEVSIVFHCAAAISFLKPLSFMMQQNVIATNNIIDLCKKLKKLDALVYTSTAFSNCNHFHDISERIYKLPFAAEESIKVLKHGSEEELMSLFLKCEPKFPNFYTFTKNISENLLSERAADMPTCIVRPSVVVSCLKGVLPGYIEEGSGLTTLGLGIGKGFIRVMLVDNDKYCNYIPADVVANTHILGAYLQNSESLPSPFIYNCVADKANMYTWDQMISSLYKMVLKYPLPTSFQTPCLTTCKSEVKYWIYSMFEHYAPAAVIDSLLWLSGRKPRLLKLYRFYDKQSQALKHFLMNEWTFESENFQSLNYKMNGTDKELFSVDLEDFTLEKMTKNLRIGAPLYKKNYSEKPSEKGLQIKYVPYYLTSMIKWCVLGCIASVFYVALF